MEELRKRITGEEFDYQALLDGLCEYDRPRDKITALLKKGVIIRVKKGIYIFGESYRRRPFSRELLANMIYGPSYISLETALHHHGLIPERVEAMMSVTEGRGRRFLTPLGLFLYHSIPEQAYPIGIDQVAIEGERSYLMATPEKAMADKIQAERGLPLLSQAEMRFYLLESLRIDRRALGRLDPEAVFLMAERYRSRKLRLLGGLIARLAGQNGREQDGDE